MRPLLSLAASASLIVAQAPVLAEGTADDIGVMSVSLKETIKPRFGFQVQSCRYLLPSTAHDAVEKRLDQKGLKALAEARSNLVAKQDAVPTVFEVLISPSAANPQ